MIHLLTELNAASIRKNASSFLLYYMFIWFYRDLYPYGYINWSVVPNEPTICLYIYFVISSKPTTCYYMLRIAMNKCSPQRESDDKQLNGLTTMCTLVCAVYLHLHVQGIEMHFQQIGKLMQLHAYKRYV